MSRNAPHRSPHKVARRYRKDSGIEGYQKPRLDQHDETLVEHNDRLNSHNNRINNNDAELTNIKKKGWADTSLTDQDMDNDRPDARQEAAVGGRHVKNRAIKDQHISDVAWNKVTNTGDVAGIGQTNRKTLRALEVWALDTFQKQRN